MDTRKMKQLLFAGVIAVGCAGTALTVQAAGQAAHSMHDQASEQPGTDTWITTKVKADLLASSNVPGTEIKVETVNGVVSLSGAVATQAEKDKAVNTAKGIKGVTRVDAAALKVSAAAKR